MFGRVTDSISLVISSLNQINDCYDGDVFDDVFAKIVDRSKFQWEEVGTESFSMSVLDGFRVPLSHQNQLLLGIEQGASRRLILVDGLGENPGLECSWERKNWPRFYWEIEESAPRSPMAHIVEKALGYWSLQPKVMMKCSLRNWRLLDKRNKTVVRVTAMTVSVGDDSSTDSRVYVSLSPVRGFVNAFQSTTNDLSHYAARQSSPVEDIQYLLERASEFDYAAKKPVSYTDDAYSASCQLMLGALNEMKSHTAGMVEDVDTEFLHQYRVNLRKTRSLLQECKRLFQGDDLTSYKRLFKQLSSLTTPVRDYDVHLLMIEDWIRRNDASELTHDILPLHKLITRKRQRALKVLLSFVHSSDYESEIESWDAFLREGVNSKKKLAKLSLGKYAAKRIRLCYRRLVLDGHKLNEDSADEAFHDLRLDFKRLRYLLEYFLGIFPQKRYATIYKRTKKLQSILGDFQDITVQKAALMGYADELQVGSSVGPRTYLCLGILLQEMGADHDGLRQQFHEMFYRLDCAENEAFVATLGKDREVESPPINSEAS